MSTEFFDYLNDINYLSSFLVSIYQSFSHIQKTYTAEHTEVFERKSQAHDFIKSLCESVVVL